MSDTELNRCVIGDCRQTLPTLPDGIFACCVTSPPYWNLRDYGHVDQIGLEATPEEYVEKLVEVFRQVRRVLRDDGTLWCNLGDSYAESGRGGGGSFVAERRAWAESTTRTRSAAPGLKPKDLVGIPWRVAFALRADGWFLRSDIIWHKPNPMPQSVSDRPTTAHEYLFLLSKSERYHYDADAIAEPHATPLHRRARKHGAQAMRGQAAIRPRGNLEVVDDPAKRYYRAAGRNSRTVWTIATAPYDGAHFATMPPALVQRCILAGAPLGGAVLDPFLGSGTVGQVAEQLGRQWFGCELSAEYAKLIAARTAQSGLPFAEGGSHG